MLRLGFVISAFASGAASLIAIQWSLRALGFSDQPQVSMFFYKILRRLLRLRVRVIGNPVTARPVIFVCKHVMGRYRGDRIGYSSELCRQT